jgi:hypothetical protein
MNHLLRKLRGLIGVSLTMGGPVGPGHSCHRSHHLGGRSGQHRPGGRAAPRRQNCRLPGIGGRGCLWTASTLTETRKRILNLSLIRVAAWGLLASAVLPFVTGMPIGMMWFVCLLGTGSATASVAIAQRAERQSLGNPTSQRYV